MPSWTGKTKGGLLGYQIFVFILNFFGLAFAYFILRIVAFYYLLFSRKSFKVIFHYFRTKFKYNVFTAFRKTYQNHFIFGQTLIDKTVLFSGIKNNFTFHFDGEHHLRKMAEDKTGGILISAHMGNWDIAGNFLNKIENNFNVVMYDEEHQKIKQYMDNVYKNKKVNIIGIKNDLSHIIKINLALGDKEFICIHGDRFIQGSKTFTKSFLGEDAEFPAGPFSIASKFRVPVAFVYAVKEGNYHYHLFCTPPKVYESGSAEEIIQDYITNLESMTRRYPEQWFNYFDFWKKPINS